MPVLDVSQDELEELVKVMANTAQHGLIETRAEDKIFNCLREKILRLVEA